MRALLNTFFVGLLLVGISLFSGCAIVESLTTTSTTTIAREVYPIEKTYVAGMVLPTHHYYETITIDAETLTLARTGGSAIATGTFLLSLNSLQRAEIERLALLVDNNDADILEDSTKFDGSNISLRLADTSTFQEMGNGGPILHHFSTDVENLSDYIETLIGDLGYADRTEAVYSSSTTPHAFTARDITSTSANLELHQFGWGDWYDFGISYWKTSLPGAKIEVAQSPPIFNRDRFGVQLIFYTVENLEPETEYSFQALYDDSTVKTFTTLSVE